MRVKFTRLAASEAREARAYYEQKQEELGARFSSELRSALARIKRLPMAWPECEPNVRRTLLNRFPYHLHYTIEDDAVVVLGIYHARRAPIAWRERRK